MLIGYYGDYKMIRILIMMLFISSSAYGEINKESFFPEVSTLVEGDVVLGDPNSAVTVVEYASLSCPHCAEYHKYILSQIKKEYVNTKKIKYIYRDFPSNNASVMGVMLARCHGDKRQKTLDVLFESQSLWAFSDKFQDHLKDIMILGGMNEAQFNECIHNNELRENIMKAAYEASKKYQITGTPVIFINGHRVENVMSFSEIKKLIGF